METTNAQKRRHQARLFLLIPVVAVPLLTLFFWAMGGGGATDETKGPDTKGFNASLPQSNVRESTAMDKMKYYDKATLDAARREELIRKDPHYLSEEDKALLSAGVIDTLSGTTTTTSSALITDSYRNTTRDKVQQRLAALQKVLNAPAAMPLPESGGSAAGTVTDDPQIEQLHEMMSAMQQPGGEDPEMQQINGMLENILDIQHPERAQEKVRKAAQQKRGPAIAVAAAPPQKYLSPVLSDAMPDYQQHTSYDRNRFYSLETVSYNDPARNAISAVVHETQTLINGARVKLRLTAAIQLGEVKIPEGTFIYGTAALKGERLCITVTGLRSGSALYPVDLTVYDMDGIEGICIPGAISRDVAKSSAQDTAQSFGVTTLDDSWGSQAAGAGIEAAKSLFTKKVKLIKVVVKAGYQVLLRDEKQKQITSN